MNVTLCSLLTRSSSRVLGLLLHSDALWSQSLAALSPVEGSGLFSRRRKKEELLPHEATKCYS